MNEQDYLGLVSGSKGQFINLSWERDVRLKASYKNCPNIKIRKHTTAVCRTGLSYDNISAVQEKRENGELPSQNGGLPWGKWKVFPWIIEHKGELYARIYNAANTNLKPNIYYTLNGVMISDSVAYTFMTPSDASRERERVSCYECFTVKLDDVKEV